MHMGKGEKGSLANAQACQMSPFQMGPQRMIRGIQDYWNGLDEE